MSHCFHNCNLALCSVPFIVDSSSLALCLEKLITIQYFTSMVLCWIHGVW